MHEGFARFERFFGRMFPKMALPHTSL